MNYRYLISLFFFTALAFSQQEASVWYFGNRAGVQFNSNGNVTAITDGQLETSEGCATIADINGNLLFYTDGRTIYNRNHQVMNNGSGLNGHSSTTQSATIVPLPGSTSLFYVFTLDAFAGSGGFCYSIIDMNLNGGLGGVTSQKNILIYTPSSEKLAIVKHSNNIDYWIVTHGWNNNFFYSYLLNSSGLSLASVISNIGSVITGSTDNVWGYMKISPDGRKLAVSNSTSNLELYDFNASTGQIDNHRVLVGNWGTYGVEFSPNSELLYASITDPQPYKIVQFDLTATDIANSIQTIYNSIHFIPSALQLGPDKKIYIGEAFKDKLSVIENPNVLGNGCSLNLEAIDLAGRFCDLGLPSYISSFFYQPLIEFENACVDESIQFNLNSNQTILNVNWDFGDGNPVTNGISPVHTYSMPGAYNVNAVVTSSLGTFSYDREITVYPKPVINSSLTLKQCDDDNDGFSIFNLTEANALISVNYQNETFTYFETADDARDNLNPINNFTSYTNQIVSNDVVYVKIANSNGCFHIEALNLNVSTTQIPLNFVRSFTVCDDAILGSNTDGVATFDFSVVNPQIQALFPSGQQLIIRYYRNLTDALTEHDDITNPANYRNIGYPNTQNIYIRVDSAINNDCLGLGQHITLNVERIPIIQPQVLRNCDDNHDGQFGFDTSNIETTLLNGLTNVTVDYFDQSNNLLSSPLPNPYNTSSQTIRAVVTNSTSTACNYQTTIQFIVDDLPDFFVIDASLTTVCDDEINPLTQDGKYAFDTSSFQNTILGNQTGMQVFYFDQNNNPLPSPLPNPFVTATQNVRVEVINPDNINCKAVYTIPFIVKPVPRINLTGNEIVCNEQIITKTLDAGIIDGTLISDYTYLWSKNGNVLANETGYTINVDQEGIYSVEVSNALGCSRIRNVTVIASDLAVITNLQVKDLSDNNTIVVTVSGNGNYMYSLDNIEYQVSNNFDHVPAGIYTLYVQDMNGCGITIREVNVLGIPEYFTPNGDGYHDYWNLKGIGQRSIWKIIIYDRFGKLIKQIDPNTLGWDGTYDGNVLPSADYWYSAELQDGRIVKGHFTLKR